MVELFSLVCKFHFYKFGKLLYTKWFSIFVFINVEHSFLVKFYMSIYEVETKNSLNESLSIFSFYVLHTSFLKNRLSKSFRMLLGILCKKTFYRCNVEINNIYSSVRFYCSRCSISRYCGLLVCWVSSLLDITMIIKNCEFMNMSIKSFILELILE